MFLTLNPMAATLLGAVLLAEPITVSFLIGLALVLSGIVVANLQWQVRPLQRSGRR